MKRPSPHVAKAGRAKPSTCFASAVALSLLVLLPACNKTALGQGAVAIVGEGVINDPGNRTLRFELLKYGLKEMCNEMTSRFAALRRQPGEPANGRFAAQTCQIPASPEEAPHVQLSFAGDGFAWLRPTGRLGFTAEATPHFAPDFRLHGDDMYVYFRTLQVETVNFTLRLAERTGAGMASALAPGMVAAMGREVLTAELKRGFTIVRKPSGATAFFPGLIPLGKAPAAPFGESEGTRRELAHGRTELAAWQQDYVGAFSVTETGKALYLDIEVDGAPDVNVLVVGEPEARRMFTRYVTERQLPPLSAPPVLSDRAFRGQRFDRPVPVPPGRYALVLTRMVPPGSPLTGAAKVDFRVELGDAP